jgi:hypothetical protein
LKIKADHQELDHNQLQLHGSDRTHPHAARAYRIIDVVHLPSHFVVRKRCEEPRGKDVARAGERGWLKAHRPGSNQNSPRGSSARHCSAKE